MTITAQTSAQIKNAVSKIFKTNKRDLQTDTSDEGVAVLAAVNTFLALEAPSFSDLTTLREAIYTYQDQDGLGIRLYKASSDVQGVVKSLIAEKQFGYTELNENLAYEGIRGVPYADILASIKANVADVSDEGSYRDLAVAIATGVGAEDDSDLVSSLEFVYSYRDTSLSQIKTSIAVVEESDIENISLNILRNSYFCQPNYLLSILSAKLLLLAAEAYKNNANISYNEVAANIKDELESLTGSFTYQDIVNAIARAMDASDNSALINALRLDIGQAQSFESDWRENKGDHSESIMRNYIASRMQYVNLSKDIIDLILDYVYLIFKPGDNISSAPGAVALSLAINDYLANGGSLASIISAISALNGDFTNRDIVDAIANIVEITDEEILMALEMDFDMSFLNASVIKDVILNVTGDDGVYIVLGIYNGLSILWPNYEGVGEAGKFVRTSSFIEARALSLAINKHHNDDNVSYEDILTNIHAAASSLIDSFTNRDLAVAVANSIGASENSKLISLLNFAFIKMGSATDAKANLLSCEGVDGPTMTISLFKSIPIACDSLNTILSPTIISLADAIETEHSSIDTSVVTISSVLGPDALTTGNNTIIGAVNELDAAVDVIRSTLTITPKTGAYLNKCTMDNEGVYTVGGSVFIGFDSEGDGILLSSMEGLNTLTGYINAMAQCATWQLTYENQDLYVSTTHAGGVTGTEEETGCSPALDFASAGAYCLSVFDNYDYA